MDERAVEKMGFEGKAAQAQASLGDDLWELHSAAAKIAEFTDGREFEDFEQSDVLRAVTRSMLEVMEGAMGRIARVSPEHAGRLACPELSGMQEPAVKDAEVWKFVRESLPGLLGRAAEELGTWHEG